MNARRKSNARILYLQLIGFALFGVLSWLDEIFLLPHHLLPHWFGSGNWHEAVLETTLVLLVSIPIVILTRRLLARLYYLESFLRICAWCKKINLEGEWLSIEEYFSRAAGPEFTHGICSACATKLKDSLPERAFDAT